MERNRPLPNDDHPIARLPEFVAGRLDAEDAAAVRRHLDACGDCTIELRAWQAVAEAAGASYAPAAASVPDGLAERVLAAVEVAAGEERRAGGAAGARATDRGRSGLARRLGWLGQFVLAQAPVVRREIWPASTVVMAIGAAVSIITWREAVAHGTAVVPGAALALFAPLAAAIGIALIYGQDNDPSLELALATPTSPRLVVVARLVLVLTWDLALALAASGLLAALDGPALFWPLVSLWLGPMLLLGCTTLLLSLFVGSSVAISAAAVLWALRALQMTGELKFQQVSAVKGLLDTIWQTSPLTLSVAVLFLVLALAAMPREQAAEKAAQ